MPAATDADLKPGAPARISGTARLSAIKVEPLTCAIGAEILNVNLGEAVRDADLMGEIRALLLKHKVIFFRDQDISRADHVAFARHFGELEDHPVAGSDPDNPGPGADLQVARLARRPLRERLALRRHLARASRRSAACCAASSAPRSAATRCGPTWRRPTSGCRSTIKTQIAGLRARHSIEASFGAAMPIEKRLALKAQFPDAEHPVVRTHPETGEKVLFVNAFTTHFTNFHTPENVRFGQDYSPGASQLLNYLISQAFVPEYQVRWRWKPNSMAFWDNRSTQHYAVMDYPPCHRKMERAGIIGDLPY